MSGTKNTIDLSKSTKHTISLEGVSMRTNYI